MTFGGRESLLLSLIFNFAFDNIERIAIEVATNWNALLTTSSVVELESLLRTYLIKINVLDSHIGKSEPPSGEMTSSQRVKKPAKPPALELQWQVLVYVADDTDVVPSTSTFDQVNKFPWVDPDVKDLKFGGQYSIVPVRSAGLNEHLKMQLFVEQPDLKAEAPSTMDIDIEDMT